LEVIKIVQAPTSGAYGYVNFGFESAEGTVAATFPRPFGQGTKITINRKNNMDRIFGLGARNAAANVAKKYEGTATVEFLLGAGNTAIGNGGASWLRAVLGAIPTDGGATPYTHSYAESNSLVSFSIANAAELGTADYVSALIGCKVQSCTITAAVDEIATVRLECPYRTETLATSGISVSPNMATEDPLNFAQGTLSVNGTTVGYVQSVELTITNNVEFIWGLGSRYSTATTGKTRTYDLKMSVKFSDVSLLMEKFFGKAASIAATDLATLNPAGVACVLTFDNGGATSASRKIVFTFANLYLNEHSLPLDVNEVITEDVTGWALSCTTIVVSNATSTDVASP
jgi:hypothetical protein